MWGHARATVSPIAFIILLLRGAAADAAEIRVWSGGAFRPVLSELGPRFERATGHKLVIAFAASPEFLQRIEAGQSFDVAILLPATIDGWIRQGRIVADTRTNIARAVLGLAVRAGAPKPDVSSADALKRTLLGVQAIAYAPAGGVGRHFAGVLERLGIAAEMKARLKPVAAGGTSPQLVARGEAELAIALVPAILTTPGVELAGPFPPELAFHVDLAAGVSASTREPEAAKALLRLLASPEGLAVIKAKGLEPIGP